MFVQMSNMAFASKTRRKKKEKSVNCFSSDCMFQGPDLALYVYLSVILCVACTTNEFH